MSWTTFLPLQPKPITSQVLRSIKRMVLMRLIFSTEFDKLDKLLKASLTGDYSVKIQDQILTRRSTVG
jgi:hypothetical protein